MNKEVEAITAEENANSELLAASGDDLNKGNKAALPAAKGKSATKSVSPASKSSKVGTKGKSIKESKAESFLIPQSGYLIIKKYCLKLIHSYRNIDLNRFFIYIY